MTRPPIRVSNLSKVYRLYDGPLGRLREAISPTRRKYSTEHWALRDISFEVQPGTTLGIVGANGAGKSTLLKILSNRLRPTSGTVELEGRVNGILELGTGLQPLLTGRQNARVNALFMGMDPWNIDEQIERIIAFSELGDDIDRPLDTYSSGMKARLAFSVLVAIQPDVLVLDEALATGDAGFAEKCTRFVRSLCRSGCTSLVVSHDIHFMTTACQKLIWIDQGRIVDQGSPDRVAASYLESFGDRLEGSHRPRFMTFRVKARDPEADPVYSFHCAAWLCPASRASEVPEANPHIDGGYAILQTHFLGLDNVLHESVTGGVVTGLTSGGSRAVWGEAKLLEGIPSPFRPLRPAMGPGRAALITLPVPLHPLPWPSGLRLFGENLLDSPLDLSVLVDGEFVPLGSFGTPELAQDFHEHQLASPFFDLEAVMNRYREGEVE